MRKAQPHILSRAVPVTNCHSPIQSASRQIGIPGSQNSSNSESALPLNGGAYKIPSTLKWVNFKPTTPPKLHRNCLPRRIEKAASNPRTSDSLPENGRKKCLKKTTKRRSFSRRIPIPRRSHTPTPTCISTQETTHPPKNASRHAYAATYHPIRGSHRHCSPNQ